MVADVLDIAEVARRAGLAPSALRFYERRGLISPTGRNGIRRTYDASVLARLTLIACARSAGFTIAQIGQFLVATPDDEQLRGRMAEKASELAAEISRLERMRRGLTHAVSCTHAPLVDCPDFKRSFDAD
ncbi:MAG TPA: MerR family transcriptional regulator [Pseudonocardia sp.]